MEKINPDNLTPLMQQYQSIKKNYKDTILFFRLGDFYEMFGEDAIKTSPILDITLTKRHNIPMCGVPYHSAGTYLAKLIKKGLKVAVCEQVEDPASAKGVVRREVVRVITPGTLVEDTILDNKKNNYLLSIYPKINEPKKNINTRKTSFKEENIKNTCTFGLAYIDISTGEFFITEIIDDENFNKILSELTRINPSEYILPSSFKQTSLDIKFDRINGTKNYLDDWIFEKEYAQEKIKEIYKIGNLKSFGIEDKIMAISASGALLNYLESTQKNNKIPLRPIKYYSIDEYMLLDESAILNLELIKCAGTDNYEDSLLGILDTTSTSMGSRLIKRYILQPLTNIEKINARHNAVELFIENGIVRRKIEEKLKNICDLDRILSRISSGLAHPRDLIALKETLKIIPSIKLYLEEIKDIEKKSEIIYSLKETLLNLTDIIKLIEETIVDEPHTDIHKPGFIKNGFNPELDELRNISKNGKYFLSQLEEKEKERTGISSLKVGYTSVFGYYIEVTKPNLHLVPPDYIRKQTLINSERFVTEELKKYEEKILSAEEKIIKLEQEIFKNIKEEILKHSNEIHGISSAIAELDVYITFSRTAEENNYCKPQIDNSNTIEIKEGRHPVIEKKLKGRSFVPNDILIDGKENQILIITGPNMAGKSTYLRQIALTVIMAQAGSFVPAKNAHIGVVDRIFTRIGSGDNLVQGESTFMVEMNETANILNNATPKSLLILDEVGRGTSTFDGISIAWACIEYLSGLKIKYGTGPKVLFATHYFELTELADKLEGVKNYNVAVREWQDEIIFLYRIIPGCSDRSYGIHVAKLAGLPEDVIERAKKILIELDKKSQFESIKLANTTGKQLDFFTNKHHPVIDEILELDINNITPLEALKILSEWKERLSLKNGQKNRS